MFPGRRTEFEKVAREYRGLLQFTHLVNQRPPLGALNLALRGVSALVVDNRLSGHAQDQYQRGEEDIRLGHEKSMLSRPDLRKVQMGPSSTDVKYHARLIGTDSTFSGLVLPTIYYCPN